MFSKYKVIVNNNVGEKLIEQIYELDKMFFGTDYLWTSDYQIDLYNKNKKSFIMVTYKGKLIGYINYLCITKEKYEETLKSRVIIDNYNIDDVVSFDKDNDNYVTINSVVIAPEYQNGEVVIKLSNRFMKEIMKLNKKGFHIAGLMGTAISEDGRKFLGRLGLNHYKTLDDGNNIYILEESK